MYNLVTNLLIFHISQLFEINAAADNVVNNGEFLAWARKVY